MNQLSKNSGPLRPPLRSESGTALIELAMVVPLLLFLVLAALEYARALDRSQWATQISREVASLAYRKCSALRGERLAACLQTRVFDRIELHLDQLAPGAQFVVAAFGTELTPKPGNPAQKFMKVTRFRLEDSEGGSSPYRQRFEDDAYGGFTETNLQRQLNTEEIGSAGFALKENRVLVVATAYIPYTPIFFGGFFGLRAGFPEVIEATTIM